MFYWFESVLYLDQVSKIKWSENTERPGYFVGFADNVGDELTFKILKNDLVTVLHRSVMRSAADSSHWNRRVSFKSDVHECWNIPKGLRRGRKKKIKREKISCKVER
jgi:hypothetical protein